MKRAVCAALIALVSSRSLLAEAEAPADSAKAEATDLARDHFQRGVEFYKEQSFDAALAEFSRAYELQANYRVLFNLGQVQLERHDYVAAFKAFRAYLGAGGDDIPAARREQVEVDLGTLRRRMAELSVKTNVAGAEVVVEGATIGSTPLRAPLQINPGLVHVLVQKAGYLSEVRTFSIVSAETKRVDIDLKPEHAAATRAPEQPLRSAPADTVHPSRTPLWIGLGLTGAFAVGAGVFAVRTHQANADLDQALATFPGDAQGISSARDRLKQDALVTDLLIGGAVLAAGLTVYIALSSPGDHKPHAELGLRPSARAHGVELFRTF